MSTVENENPPEDARRLAAFLGVWTIEGALVTGGVRAPLSGRWEFQRAIDGWGVGGMMETEIEGMGAFQEQELIGSDTAGGNVHLFSMNRYAIRDHVGGWTGEDRLTVRYEGLEGERHITEEITIDFEAPDRMIGRVVEHADGELVITTDLTATRDPR